MDPNYGQTRLATLNAQLDQCLANLTTILAKPKPSYSVGGQSVSWDAYKAGLEKTIEFLRQQIQIEGGPVEFQTRAFTGGPYG